MMKTRQPLSGIRVLVGRAQHQASRLSDALKAFGAEIIEIPFIEIRPPRSYKALDSALMHISKYDWLILTSVNGVQALSARMYHLGISPDQLKNLQIAAIGPATKAEIEKLGLTVSVVPRQYLAESVVESLRGEVLGKRVLLARARVARDVIPVELRRIGAQVDVVEAYETVVPRSSQKRLLSVVRDGESRPHVVTFTSSSTVRNFVNLLGGARANLEGIQFASIGPITSATLREFRLPVHIEASEYTISGLVNAIARNIHSGT